MSEPERQRRAAIGICPTLTLKLGRKIPGVGFEPTAPGFKPSRSTGWRIQATSPGAGIEPASPGSKPGMLPLHHPGMRDECEGREASVRGEGRESVSSLFPRPSPLVPRPSLVGRVGFEPTFSSSRSWRIAAFLPSEFDHWPRQESNLLRPKSTGLQSAPLSNRAPGRLSPLAPRPSPLSMGSEGVEPSPPD